MSERRSDIEGSARVDGGGILARGRGFGKLWRWALGGGVVAVMLLGRAARAEPATGVRTLGVSACALIEGVPGAEHPLRRAPALRRVFGLLDRAGTDEKRNSAVLKKFYDFLEPLYREAERVFMRPPYDAARDERAPFAMGPAKAFLERWVLVANAPLRVGLEGFEPAGALAAGMALAACRAGAREEVVGLVRRLSGVEAGGLRAVGALMLWERGDDEGARELVAVEEVAGRLTAGEAARGVELLAAAELEEDMELKKKLHEAARAQGLSPDAQVVWQGQARRMRSVK